MTPEDIERMAREAGMHLFEGAWYSDCQENAEDVSTAALARFAALVRAQALEEAARTCLILDALFVPTDDYSMPPGPHQCAAAIRALGDTQ